MKILLIKPAGSIAEECCGGSRPHKMLPAQMVLCASFLRRMGLDVGVNDLQVQPKANWNAFDVLVFWISVVDTFFEEIALVREAKKLKRMTIVVPNDAFGLEIEIMKKVPEIDALVQVHERELTLHAFLHTLASAGEAQPIPGILLRRGDQVLDGGPCPPAKDLSHLESAVDIYRELPLGKYNMAHILTGKGCPFPCDYCNYRNTRPRKRPIREIIRDIEFLMPRFRSIILLDLNIAVDKTWVKEFLAELSRLRPTSVFSSDCRIEDLQDSNLLALFKGAGFIHLTVGIEHVSQEILEGIHKVFPNRYVLDGVRNCKKAGIIPFLCFMVGLPEESEHTLRELDRFLSRPPYFPFDVYPVIPSPKLLPRYAERNLIRKMGLEAIVSAWTELPYRSQFLSAAQIQEAAVRLKSKTKSPGYLFESKLLRLICILKSRNFGLIFRQILPGFLVFTRKIAQIG